MTTKQFINVNLSDLGQAFLYSKGLLVMKSVSPFLKEKGKCK